VLGHVVSLWKEACTKEEEVRAGRTEGRKEGRERRS